MMVPWGLTKAGLSLAICSGVEGRMPLSALTGLGLPEGKGREESIATIAKEA